MLMLALTGQPAAIESGPTSEQFPTMSAPREGRPLDHGRIQPSLGFRGPTVSREEAQQLIEPFIDQGSAALIDRLGHSSRVDRNDGVISHTWEEYAVVSGGWSENGIGQGSGQFRQEYCSLHIVWTADDLIRNWSINGQQTACERIFRWLR